ncbi:MAG: hypothetical protein ACXWNK_03720 [Vulcanimicrobiaceae bacterium]
MGVVFLAISLLTGVAALGGPPLPQENPYYIYSHARDVWMAQRYPDYIAYTVVIDVDEKGVPKANHYHSVYDAMHDVVHVNAVSDEEKISPHVSSGVNIHLRPKRQFQTIIDRRVGNPEEMTDFLGVPLLAPNYSFGIAPYIAPQQQTGGDQLVQAIRQQYKDPMPAAKAQQMSSSGPLKEIASVTSTRRDYVMTLQGTEQVAGRVAYHVSLRPVHDPRRLRLRELWVDTQSFETLQLITAGNFTGIGANVPWTVTFDDVDGVRYIASEMANAPVSVGEHTYDRASISFEQIESTHWSPLWVNGFTSSAAKSIEEPRT